MEKTFSTVVRWTGAITVVAAFHFVGAGLFGLRQMREGVLPGFPENRSTLSAKSMANFQDGLRQSLRSSKSPYVFLGNDGGCDARQEQFVSEYKTLEIFAQNGVKQIFMYVDRADKKQFDAVASGEKKDLTVTRDCSWETNRELDFYDVRLIRYANTLGMEVFPSKPGTETTAANQLMGLPLYVEGTLLSKVSQPWGNLFERWGRNWLHAPNDIAETAVATEITNHPTNGRSLIYDRRESITTASPYALISKFPSDSLTLTFEREQNEPESMSRRFLCKNGNVTSADGVPLRPTYGIMEIQNEKFERCHEVTASP